MLAAFEVVLAVLVELGGCDVKGEGDILAGFVASLLNGLHDEIQCFLGGANGGSETALVTQAGRQALFLDNALQSVVDLGTDA